MSEFKSILKLDALDVKKFLLQEESYCNFSLPTYFNFNNLLKEVDSLLEAEDFRNVTNCKPSKFTGGELSNIEQQGWQICLDSLSTDSSSTLRTVG